MTTQRRLHRFGPVIIGCVVLLTFAWLYDLDALLSGPGGIHYIRQTDSLAFITYFREYGINLFEPGILDLRNAPEEGKCAGEFPVVYWSIAVLERMFGDMPHLLKWVNLFLVAFGHLALGLALLKIFRKPLLAAATVVLVSGSGIVVYYACNFLPDAAAYGMVLFGWSVVMPCLFEGRIRPNGWTALAFVLAGLMKAPASMHLFAWMIMVQLSSVQPRCERLRKLLGQVLILGVVFGWHVYARWYNEIHDSNYFMTWSEPIWDMNAVERSNVTDLVWNYWWTKYLHPTVWHTLILMISFLVFAHRSVPRPVRWLLLLLLSASTAFILLFFRKFADHDYYFLTLMPTVVWLFAAGTHTVQQYFTGWSSGSIVPVGISVLAISALILAKTEFVRRTTASSDRFSKTDELIIGLDQDLVAQSLAKDSRVIVVGDSSVNGALLSLRRLGWTYPGPQGGQTPDMPVLLRAGATHVLYLGHPPGNSIGADPLTHGPNWSLWSIRR